MLAIERERFVGGCEEELCGAHVGCVTVGCALSAAGEGSCSYCYGKPGVTHNPDKPLLAYVNNLRIVSTNRCSGNIDTITMHK
jgi:hypothetical protein